MEIYVSIARMFRGRSCWYFMGETRKDEDVTKRD